MSKFKCFCLLIALLFAVITLCPIVATATPQYVRVTTEEVKLYTNAETKKVTCLLVQSYYLTVIDRDATFYKVELMDNSNNFPKIVGYVQIDDVEECIEQPELPLYPQVTITVSADSARIQFSPLDTAQTLVIATNTQQMSYYGKFVDQYDNVWYYVYYNGYFGYVKSNQVTQPNVPLHPTPLQPDQPTVEPPTQQENPTTTVPTNPTNEILLIAFAGILSTCLVLALFLPQQKSKKVDSLYNDHY